MTGIKTLFNEEKRCGTLPPTTYYMVTSMRKIKNEESTKSVPSDGYSETTVVCLLHGYSSSSPFNIFTIRALTEVQFSVCTKGHLRL